MKDGLRLLMVLNISIVRSGVRDISKAAYLQLEFVQNLGGGHLSGHFGDQEHILESQKNLIWRVQSWRKWGIKQKVYILRIIQAIC